MDNQNALVSVNGLITTKEQELDALKVAQKILADGYTSDQGAIAQAIEDGVDQRLPQEVAARTATLEAEKAALEAQVADTPNQIAAATAPLEAAIAEKETLLAEKDARIAQLEAAAQPGQDTPAEEVTP